MIVVDTTVLVYSLGRAHHLREPCQELLSLVGRGDIRATTSVEAIQEFCHVRSRRTGRAEAASLAREHYRLLRPLLRPDADDLLDGLEAFAGGQDIGSFDAVLGAAAHRRNLPVASADSGFDEIQGLTRLDPASPTFLDDCLRQGS